MKFATPGFARDSRPEISVVVTTYNRPAALARVLEGLATQFRPPVEVIVADDGSAAETGDLIAERARDMPFPLLHVWQEDRGFRAAAARNRAVTRCRGDYLVFLDGDSIPCPRFLGRHTQLACPGWFVAGNRVLLDPSLTEDVESGEIDPCAWNPLRWLSAAIRGKINRLSPLVRLPGNRWRERTAADWRKVRTCNLGVWRSDLIAVNGFDERFQGWGHEDADLAVRLIRNGTRHLDGRWAIPVLHLWHPEFDRGRERENRERLERILGSDRVRAKLGLDQYRS